MRTKRTEEASTTRHKGRRTTPLAIMMVEKGSGVRPLMTIAHAP